MDRDRYTNRQIESDRQAVCGVFSTVSGRILSLSLSLSLFVGGGDSFTLNITAEREGGGRGAEGETTGGDDERRTDLTVRTRRKHRSRRRKMMRMKSKEEKDERTGAPTVRTNATVFFSLHVCLFTYRSVLISIGQDSAAMRDELKKHSILTDTDQY